MIGMSRAQIAGKTARELFSVEAAELIERRDRELLERKQQTETIVSIPSTIRSGAGARLRCEGFRSAVPTANPIFS